MSPNDTKIHYGGELINGVEVEFKPLSESWNEYETEDGAIVRVKLIVSRIIRTEKYKEDGEPIYVIKSSNVASVKVPVNLMKSKN